MGFSEELEKERDLCNQCGRKANIIEKSGQRVSIKVCLVCGFKTWLTLDRNLKTGKPYRIRCGNNTYMINRRYRRTGYGSSLVVTNDGQYFGKIFSKPITEEDRMIFAENYFDRNTNQKCSCLIGWNSEFKAIDVIPPLKMPFALKHPDLNPAWDPSGGQVLFGEFWEQHFLLPNLSIRILNSSVDYSGWIEIQKILRKAS